MPSEGSAERNGSPFFHEACLLRIHLIAKSPRFRILEAHYLIGTFLCQAKIATQALENQQFANPTLLTLYIVLRLIFEEYVTYLTAFLASKS